MKCPNKDCPYNDDECQHIADFKDYKMCDLYRESIKQPKTNADRIRAMSDEKLSEFISNSDMWAFLCENNIDKVLDWLKQEVE